ncbi:sugar ABC transporter ATP-binding protein [Alicyclobacillus acidiphilus]|uniref:sugar ABC transporter ATP-binding protein n=1 Tax=Alicyclobacillus acidiphilus TaxID=182455 RepID=UPI00082C7D59|nr:sugar ABC transporter ATP-binding protein [Alicyclobacillus acidiphilus]
MASIFQANGIAKQYGPNRVLNDVNLQLHTGKIHALVGHNGAGKSTLLKILSGVERPSEGSLSLDYRNVVFNSPRDAHNAGVICVYQELRLVNELTVAENIFLGHEIKAGGILDRKKMNRLASELLNSHGLDIDPTLKVIHLSHPEKQFVEILAALQLNAKFLLLDEPTTSLEFNQIEDFLKTIRDIADTKDVGIVLVTHKLDEVYAVADEITVLCDGEVKQSGSINNISRDEIVSFIIGREAEGTEITAQTGAAASSMKKTGEPVLSAKNVRTSKIQDVSLQAYRGQVLGIYGLGGSGRTEFLRALYGLDPLISGHILLNGKPYQPKSPIHAIRSGIAYITEERKVDGFIPEMDSIVNAALPSMRKFSKGGFVQKDRMRAAVMDVLKQLQIRGNPEEPIRGLSGGNQQKILFAKVILQDAELLLFDEPTKGIDIGAKSEIYSLIRRLVEERDVSVIVVSSEEDEILAVSDQIAIFRAGRCSGKLYPREEMNAALLRSISLEDKVMA